MYERENDLTRKRPGRLAAKLENVEGGRKGKGHDSRE